MSVPVTKQLGSGFANAGTGYTATIYTVPAGKKTVVVSIYVYIYGSTGAQWASVQCGGRTIFYTTVAAGDVVAGDALKMGFHTGTTPKQFGTGTGHIALTAGQTIVLTGGGTSITVEAIASGVEETA